MPLCLVFERKEGTVCRAGLDRRVQSKCFVAELLSREQKVAHIVVVSFPLHQIKTFFFFFFSGRPGLQLLNPSRRVKWDVCSCKFKRKKKLAFQYSTFWNTSSNRQNEVWCFCGQRQTMLSVYSRALSTPNLSHSGFKPVAFSHLKGSWEALTDWERSIVRSTVHDHPAMSTQALILWFVSILITRLRRFKLPLNTLLKDRSDANLGQDRVLSERRGRTEILYLTPRMLQPVWKNCADKLAALWNETSFWGDNGAHSSTQRGTQEAFPVEFFTTQKWSCCLLLEPVAGANTSLYGTRVRWKRWGFPIPWEMNIHMQQTLKRKR